MNHTIATIFKGIPLFMGAICISLGWYVYAHGDNPSRLLPGTVIFFLAAICIALFSTAATIISQLMKRFKPSMKYSLPGLGYVVALATFIIGIIIFKTAHTASLYVAGHIVSGLGLITGCVSTAAASSTKFYLIPINSESGKENTETPAEAFSNQQAKILKALPILFSLIAWLWAFSLLSKSIYPTHFIAGYVMFGLATICTSLISLVWSITNQVCNTYQEKEKKQWPYLVLVMGSLSILAGLYILLTKTQAFTIAPGYVLIGLGLICYSISSKVILLALVWKNSYPLANRIPLIPIFTALICLFLAAFLFEAETTNAAFFVPARVMVGLGGICFCLFSIVSILESGTSGKK